MAKKIIDSENGEGYNIQPGHINTGEHFCDAFGNCETEVSARLIVSLCQAKGGWIPFTKEEIDKHTNQGFHFNRLCDCREPKNNRNYVILGEDGKYRVTHEFIATCFKSSPAI
jgi:hypothetical protein